MSIIDRIESRILLHGAGPDVEVYRDAKRCITEVAAFLDGMVTYLTDGEADAITDTAKAADCRKMARRLRGET